jgi:hypothetical protein
MGSSQGAYYNYAEFNVDVSGTVYGSTAMLSASAVDLSGNPLSGSLTYYWY